MSSRSAVLLQQVCFSAGREITEGQLGAFSIRGWRAKGKTEEGPEGVRVALWAGV